MYENNKSMAPAIRAQISRELGVEPVLINSALVSAQNRQRLYWVGRRKPDGTYAQVPVRQPEDRGILLRQILETAIEEKGYILKHAGKALSPREMEYMVRATASGRNHFDFNYHHNAANPKSSCVTSNIHKGVPYNALIEPIRIGTVQNSAKNQNFDSQQYRVYSPDGKAVTLCGNGAGLTPKPVCTPRLPPSRTAQTLYRFRLSSLSCPKRTHHCCRRSISHQAPRRLLYYPQADSHRM